MDGWPHWRIDTSGARLRAAVERASERASEAAETDRQRGEASSKEHRRLGWSAMPSPGWGTTCLARRCPTRHELPGSDGTVHAGGEEEPKCWYGDHRTDLNLIVRPKTPTLVHGGQFERRDPPVVLGEQQQILTVGRILQTGEFHDLLLGS